MRCFLLSVFFSFPLLFSHDFFWGVAISEYQNSGSDTVCNSNWSKWEKEKKINSGLSNNHYNNYMTHIEALEDLGCNAFRMSVEWSLIEPEEGVFDLAVIKRYREEFDALIKRGITPMVTMHHFTEPLWFTKKGGFEKEENIACFEKFAGFVFEEFSDKIKYWNTINEPAIAAFMPYQLGRWPPCKVNIGKGMAVLKNLLQSHVRVYHLCKEINASAQIGFVHSFLRFKPNKESNPLEKGVAYFMTKNWNTSVVNFFKTGHLILDFPLQGSLDIYDDKAADSYDFVGVNYYSTPIFKFTPFKGPWFDVTCPQGSVMTDMPYHSDPEGFYETLIACKEFNKPIYVTENGIADRKDDRRLQFIQSYLMSLMQAKKDGCDIRGYFYWTLFDNFEWSDGYEMKFGLFDFDKESGKIEIKRGGEIYRDFLHRKLKTDTGKQNYLKKYKQKKRRKRAKESKKAAKKK